MKKYYFLPLLIAFIFPCLVLEAQCDRQTVVQDYIEHFLGSSVSTSALAWSGSVNGCEAGNVSATAREHTLMRINYFRRLVGLPDNITFNDALNEKAQAAALMMDANNSLSHSPPNSWSCYTEAGAEAASKSNLALGAHSANAIALYIRDPGSNNTAVGHRRWILYSRAKEFGSGSTSTSNSLWVIGSKASAPEGLEYIAYPSAGFFPAPLVYPRWSFSKPGANFSQAEVSMKNAAGQSIPLDIKNVANGYGDNTLVWEPDMDLIPLKEAIDQEIEVTVSNVGVKGNMESFSYTVIMIQPQHPPQCPGTQTWSENACGCEENLATSIAVDLKSAIAIYPNPSQGELKFALASEILGPLGIQVKDQLGKTQISARTLLAGQRKLSLDISALSAGIYYVQVKTSTGIHTEKILKQ